MENRICEDNKMLEQDVLLRIKNLCNEKNWTVYRLSIESDVPYSTLSTMFKKTNIPTIPTLMKLCNALGITMSQFFTDSPKLVELTDEQFQMFQKWIGLSTEQKYLLLKIIENFKE